MDGVPDSTMPDPDTELPTLVEIATNALRENPGYFDEGVGEHEAARVVGEAVAPARSKRTRGGSRMFVEIEVP